MATKSHRLSKESTTPAPSRGPMIVLIAGSIAIAALVGWALTRSVEPAPPNDPVMATPMPPTATAATTTTLTPGMTATNTAPPATATAAQPATGERGGVTRMQPQELKGLVDRGAVTIVDVRDSVSYANGHIPGAVHIPFARIEGESRYLPKDKPIVLYCT